MAEMTGFDDFVETMREAARDYPPEYRDIAIFMTNRTIRHIVDLSLDEIPPDLGVTFQELVEGMTDEEHHFVRGYLLGEMVGGICGILRRVKEQNRK